MRVRKRIGIIVLVIILTAAVAFASVLFIVPSVKISKLEKLSMDDSATAQYNAGMPDEDTIYGWATDLVDMGVRLPGTEAGEEAQSYVMEKFEEFGLEDVTVIPAKTSLYTCDSCTLAVDGEDVFTDVPYNTLGSQVEYIDSEVELGSGDHTLTISAYEASPSAYIADIMETDIAIYNHGSWMDTFITSTTELYNTMKSTNSSRMIIDPGYHETESPFWEYCGEDVDEDGNAVLVTEGVLTAGFAATYDNDTMIQGGTDVDVLPDLIWHGFEEEQYVSDIFADDAIVELAITLFPTSWTFSEGHSIRISIACANSPTFATNSALSEDTVVTVYRDSEHQSKITLPIIPE